MDNIKFYIRQCKNEYKYIMCAFFTLILSTYVSIKIPFKMQNMIDMLLNIKNQKFETYFLAFCIVSFLMLSRIVIDYYSGLIFKKLGNRISFELSQKIITSLYNNRTDESEAKKQGKIIVALERDIFDIGESGLLIVYDFIILLINIASIFYYMAVTNISLLLIVMSLFILLSIIQNRSNIVMEKIVATGRERSEDYSEKVNELAVSNEEIYRLKLIKYFKNTFGNRLLLLQEKRYEMIRFVSRLSLINGVFNLFNMAIVFIIGAFFVVSGGIQLGSLITFSTYSNNFGGYIGQIPSMFMRLKTLKVSLARVRTFEEMSSVLVEEDGDISENSTLNFTKIKYSYNKEKILIDDHNMIIKSGKSYCVVGANGVGKTTLLKIIAGEINVDSGNVWCKGRQGQLSREELREMSHFMSSKPFITKGTVQENIDFENIHSKDDIHDMIIKLGFNDLYEKHDSFLDILINDQATCLSSGDKQKVAIIRAFMNPYKLIVIDEIEKHLDTQSKTNVIKYIKEYMTDKIVVLASHDEIIQEHCDEAIIIR